MIMIRKMIKNMYFSSRKMRDDDDGHQTSDCIISSRENVTAFLFEFLVYLMKKLSHCRFHDYKIPVAIPVLNR